MASRHLSGLRRRSVLIPSGVVLALAISGGAWAATHSSSQNGAVTYRQVAVGTGTIRQTVSATGTVTPATTASLSFGVAGKVSTVTAQVGQQVTAGQVLATLSSPSLAAGVAQARAQLANNEAKLSADTAASASSAQIAADNAAIAASQALLKNAQQALGDATLTSPINGTVAAVGLTAGDQVSASAGGGSAGGSGGGSANGQVVVISPAMVVDAGVDDTEIGLVKPGMQAVMTVTGTPKAVDGTVSSVGLMATISSGVATFPVTIAVTGTPTGLYAGSSVQVEIVYQQLTNVLELPSAAVHVAGRVSTVLTGSPANPVSTKVTTGVSSGGMTQITGGLTNGEKVLIERSTGAGGTTGSTRRGGFGFGGGGLGGGGGRGPGGAPKGTPGGGKG